MATSRRTFRDAIRIRRVAGSGAALIFAAAGLLLTAGVASAHNPSASLTCADGGPVLTISIINYTPTVTNTIAASIDGTSVLPVTDFGGSFSTQITGSDPTVGHTAKVNVTAGDDPTGSKGWTREFDLSVDPCASAPSKEPSSAPSTAPSTAPSGGVEAATATPPATATIDPAAPVGPSSGIGFLMILFAIVALVVGFAPIATRRKARRNSKRQR